MTRSSLLNRLLPGAAFLLAATAFVVLLGACTAVAPTAPVPAGTPAAAAPAFPVVLVISGTGASGDAVQVELAAATGLVFLNPDESIHSALTESISTTPYVELALVKNGAGNKWRLFYSDAPTGVITPTAAQIYLRSTGALTVTDTAANDAANVVDRSSPAYQITSVSPLSPTAVPGTMFALEDAIALIRAANNESNVRKDRLVARVTPFFLLTDGAAENPTRTLVIFGAIQEDGSPNPPAGGICDDVRQSCTQTQNGYWYCTPVVVKYVCS